MLKRTFDETAGYDEIIMLRDIPFQSFCEHHLAPITGFAHTCAKEELSEFQSWQGGGYFCSQAADPGAPDSSDRRRHTEGLTSEGVAVVIKATNGCITTTSVHKHISSMVTSRMLGCFRDNPATRHEFKSGLSM